MIPPHPVPPLLLRIALGTTSSVAVAAALGGAVGWVEGGLDASSVWGIAWLVAPIALAAVVAWVVQDSRRRGEWQAWDALGHRPRDRWLAIGLLGMLCMPLGGPRFEPQDGALGVLASPSAVDTSLRWWPAERGWAPRQPGPFDAAPGSLELGELAARVREVPPPHIRRGPYRAELIRRAGWLLAWPLAAVAGILASRKAQARSAVTASAARAGAVLLGWCIAVLVWAGYASTST